MDISDLGWWFGWSSKSHDNCGNGERYREYGEGRYIATGGIIYPASIDWGGYSDWCHPHCLRAGDGAESLSSEVARHY